MRTLANRACQQQIDIATTRACQIIDITDSVEEFVARSHIAAGLVNVQSLHTTTGLIINEHERLLLTDFERLLTRLAPVDVHYAHDHEPMRMTGERANGHSHCRALLLGSSACLNVADGRLVLGRWQRILFVELDGPRQRSVSVVVLGGDQ